MVSAVGPEIPPGEENPEPKPGEPEQVRLIIEVVAGVLPGTPLPEFTKRYPITSREWADAGDKQGFLLAEKVGEANGYATLLMNSPNMFNWVRTDWIWL